MNALRNGLRMRKTGRPTVNRPNRRIRILMQFSATFITASSQTFNERLGLDHPTAIHQDGVVHDHVAYDTTVPRCALGAGGQERDDR